MKSKGPSLTLLQQPLISSSHGSQHRFLVVPTCLLINLYRSDIFTSKNAKLVRWSAHLLVLGLLSIMVSFTFELATRVIVSLTSAIC